MANTNDTRCHVIENADLEPGRSITVVPEPNRGYLSEKRAVDYRNYREQFLVWLLQFGKNESKAVGYSPYTVYETGLRTAAFDRWAWDSGDGYDVPPDEDDALAYMREVAVSDRARATKGKIQEALGRYNTWLQRDFGVSEWEFDFRFDSSGSSGGVREFLTESERRTIRSAMLDFDDRWKFTSLIWCALDAGLRPVEVNRARTTWVDTENAVLRIPKEESSKTVGDWTVSLTERTAMALDKWLTARAEREHYDDGGALWRTRRGNRYASKSLSRLLKRVCEHAGIDTTNRTMTFYAIRHSVGTYMTKERGLEAAKAQLRHKSPKTTMKYDQVPVEDRRAALDRMG